MNLRSIDLNLLTVFDAVMSERNISRAADKIGMSQPAMSAALGRLRLVVKDELFIRTGRGVRPTSRAVELEIPIHNVLNVIKKTLSQPAEFDCRSSKKTFNLASMDLASVLIVPMLLRRLHTLGAGISVNICSFTDQQILDRMRRSQVDFNIDYKQIVDDDFHNILVHTDTACCLANKEHSVFKNEMTRDSYLQAQHLVVPPHAGRASVIDEYLKSQDVVRHKTMTVPSLLSYPYIIANSDLISTLPRSVAEVYADKFDLKLFDLPFGDFSVNYYLMWHKSFDDDHSHSWLKKILLDICNNL